MKKNKKNILLACIFLSVILLAIILFVYFSTCNYLVIKSSYAGYGASQEKTIASANLGKIKKPHFIAVFFLFMNHKSTPMNQS